MVRCPKVPVYFLFALVVLEPLVWTQWRPVRRVLAANLGRGWRRRAAPNNGLPSKGHVLRYLSCLAVKFPGTSTDSHNSSEGKTPPRPLVWRRQGCGSRHWPWRAQVPAHSARSRTGQALKSGVPPCLGLAGDRDWSRISGCRVWGFSEERPKPRHGSRLNREGKHETCSIAGASLRIAMVLFKLYRVFTKGITSSADKTSSRRAFRSSGGPEIPW